MHGIDKLLGEIVICSTRRKQFVALQTLPIEAADLVYDSLVSVSYLDVHAFDPSSVKLSTTGCVDYTKLFNWTAHLSQETGQPTFNF
jgi:hypothetical protein